MDCLKSFSFSSQANNNYTGGEVKTWTTGAQEYWAVDSTFSSTFNIQGFKNINVYGVDVIGTFSTLNGATLGGCVIEDWGIQILLNGQIPLVSGQIVNSPNQWSISNSGAFSKVFEVSKFNSGFRLSSPFESVKSVQLINLRANGFGGQTSGNINLYWNLNFVFHYQYEG